MHRRRITLADGRYLIFFTFDEEEAPGPAAGQNVETELSEARATPQAEEERSV
jgi:hypothetical protein